MVEPMSGLVAVASLSSCDGARTDVFDEWSVGTRVHAVRACGRVGARLLGGYTRTARARVPVKTALKKLHVVAHSMYPRPSGPHARNLVQTPYGHGQIQLRAT